MTYTESNPPYRIFPNFIFAAQTDQSTLEAFFASDYMQAQNSGSLTAEDAPDGVSLLFHHVMAMWEVEVVAAGGAQLDGMHVELYDWPYTSEINLRRDYTYGMHYTSRDPDFTASIPMLRVETDPGAETYTYRALAPYRDKGPGETLFTFAIGGRVYDFKSPEYMDTWDNHVYRYKVTINGVE